MRTVRSSRVRIASATLAAALLSPALAASAQTQQENPEDQQATLELSLQDVIELALRHNLQVRLLSLNPDLSEEAVRFQRGAFDPVFTFNVPQSFARNTQPQSSALSGADVLTTERIAGGFSLQQNTGWGLGWSFSGNVSRSVTNNEFSTFNPQYDTSLSLNVRQPLLRNFGRGVNEQGLRVARNNYAVSEEQFRQQLQSQLFQVVQGYWNLVFQYRSMEISRRALTLAQEQLDQSNTRVRIGVQAAVDVIQTQQQVAAAELSVIQSEIALRNQEDTLKQLLNLDDVTPDGWDVEIVPTEEPTDQAEDIDVEAAVEEALRRNPAILQDRINAASRKIDLRAASNQLLPRVDFVGSITTNGLGGDQIFRSGVFDSGVTEVQKGGISDSLQQLLSGDYRNWSLGLQVSFPVRNDQARAQYAQASIRERQATTQVRDRELQVRLQVRTNARNVEGGAEQVAAAQDALALSERQYTAELRRFEEGAGNSSTFQVLSFQRQLTNSQQNELRALINLNIALAAFQLAKGTLLDWLNVEVDNAGTGGPMIQARSAGSDTPEASAAPAITLPIVPPGESQRR